MQISLDYRPNLVVVTLDGRLDTLSSEAFDQSIVPLTEKGDHLVIDFASCKYLASSGIRSLISVSKRLAKTNNARLYLAGVQPGVYHVLEMAGLHKVFSFASSVAEAVEKLEKMGMDAPGSQLLPVGPLWHAYGPDASADRIALCWKDQGIAGYDELLVSVGEGSPAEGDTQGKLPPPLFVTIGQCAGFIPRDQNTTPDFRLALDPSQAGIHVSKAISFRGEASAHASLASPGQVGWQELMQLVASIRQAQGHQAPFTGLVLASGDARQPLIAVGLIWNTDEPRSGVGSDCVPAGQGTLGSAEMAGSCFLLEELIVPEEASCLDGTLKSNLQLINMTGVRALDPGELFTDPKVWLFAPDQVEDASAHRLLIEAPADFFREPYKAFLCRRLCRDSSKVRLKALQGGFSAQTFHLGSWDEQERQLRPTVLKIASRDMITREATRCQQYAMPYILNNSAMILGTQFFGDKAALRYNFVGIGGGQSKLKWLTHYFEEWSPEKLKPLFDKIFLDILNPWYGQSVPETIYPFKDHDPTKTFFPHLFQEADKVLNVSPGEPWIRVSELDRELRNPYWFLKHRYPELSRFSLDYKTAICHGDLNMQNILLDEMMNVYLIDFSETRPRSVVSDFARMEAIFMIEFSALENDSDLVDYLALLDPFYRANQLDGFSLPAAMTDNSSRRNFFLSQLMRNYALINSGGNRDPLPYTLALLEWVLPVVCYVQSSLLQKRLSMIVAGFLCERLEQWLAARR